MIKTLRHKHEPLSQQSQTEFRIMGEQLKDSLPIMKFHKTALFSPPMTEFEHPDHFWSDKYAMTSSVKIFKN